jgi:hypothetical protein
LNDEDTADVEKKDLKQEHAKKSVSKKSPFEITNRLWESLVLPELKWRPNGPICRTHLQNLANQLTKELFKSTEKYF